MKMPSYQTCLLEMNFTNDKWSLTHVPSFSDTTANEVYPNFSTDGDTLYFCSDRNINTFSSYKNTLWYVIKKPEGWSQAKVLDTNLFKKDIYANSISKNGTRYFTIGPHGTSDWNIYKTDKSGEIYQFHLVPASPKTVLEKPHLVDILKRLGINIVKVFGPEHGFRDDASAGTVVGDETDAATGIPVISLYGKKNKPTCQC